MGKFSEHIPLHRIKTKEMGPLGFSIIDLGGNTGKVYDSSVPHRHTFFELLFFTSGKGSHEIDFNLFNIEAGCVHFVSHGQIHKLNLKNTTGYVICFNEDFIALNSNEDFTEKFAYYGGVDSPALNLDKKLKEEILVLISSVLKDMNPPRASKAEIYRAYLNIILLKLKERFESVHSSSKIQQSKKQKVILFKKHINSGFIGHKSISYYAEKLHTSPNHLNALCKKHEGRTAIQLIQDRMLLEAKRLLYATDMSIKEISFYLNFEDVAYFNRFFKKQTLLTPLDYRHEQISKNR